MAHPNSTEPLDYTKEFTSFAQDINLITEGPTVSPKPKREARLVRCVAGSGTLVVETEFGNCTLTLAAGDFEIIKARKIIASGTSGMTRVRVGW